MASIVAETAAAPTNAAASAVDSDAGTPATGPVTPVASAAGATRPGAVVSSVGTSPQAVVGQESAAVSDGT
ncbi:hypothetical protein ACWEPH_24475, partial [Nocardia beijingensis]